MDAADLGKPILACAETFSFLPDRPFRRFEEAVLLAVYSAAAGLEAFQEPAQTPAARLDSPTRVC